MLTLPNFADSSYLSRGSSIQQWAHNLILKSKILYHLREHHPVVTGSLPIDLFIPGSDVDISCDAKDLTAIEQILKREYSGADDFFIEQRNFLSIPTILCRFRWETLPFEIFCQPVQVEDQTAYRHMIVEYRILQEKGDDFKQKVLTLKQGGIKTEPAFAKELGLTGDPYLALLNYT